MGKDNYYLRCLVITIALLTGIICQSQFSYAAFPVPAAPAAVVPQHAAVDTVYADDCAQTIRTPKQIHRSQTLAVASGIVAIALFAVAAAAAVTGLLVGWFVLALVSIISAQTKSYIDKRKYTPGQIIGFIAILPIIAVLALFYGSAAIIFGLPAMLVRRLKKGSKGKPHVRMWAL